MSLIADRSRSPRAPKHALPEAIKYAETIYNGVHRSVVSSAMAFELMGFNGKSGASSTALGSVRQYGLIDGTGDKTRVSDLALVIFEPSSPKERSLALREAAEKPDVFQAIRTRFNDRIPTADEPIRAFLIRELNFQKSSAEETVKALRETEAYIKEVSDEGDMTTDVISPEKPAEALHDTPKPAPLQQTSGDLVRVPLTRECFAELRFNGVISSKAIANLVKYIEFMKDVWSEDETEAMG